MPELVIYILIKLALVIVVFALWMTMVPVLIWMERKVIADIQIRLGPNRVGPFGLLQPIADALKLIMKENITPREVDTWVYRLAPLMLMVPALLAIATIPIGGVVHIGDRSFGLQIMGAYHSPTLDVPELDAGILLVLALSSLGVYGVVLAGWSSANKYSLLGGMRSSAQMLSYELPLGVALLGPIVLAGTLRLAGVVEAQGSYGIWFIIPQFLGFVIYLMSATAEVNRAPFDLPEAESELIGGYHTEYSSFRFAMFFMAEYVNMVTVSAICVTFFLGGYRLFWNDFPWLGPVWFVVKLLALLYFFMWVRGTWPRVRFDQLMKLGWKMSLPFAMVNVVATAVLLALFPDKPIIALTAMSLVLGTLAYYGFSYAINHSLRKAVADREQKLRESSQESQVSQG